MRAPNTQTVPGIRPAHRRSWPQHHLGTSAQRACHVMDRKPGCWTAARPRTGSASPWWPLCEASMADAGAAANNPVHALVTHIGMTARIAAEQCVWIGLGALGGPVG